MAPAAGSGSLGFQPYGTGNFVVTRPGTLLFPPLQAPTSTLIPGFAGAGDSHTANHAARTQAFDNAFAEGPEPSSQLLTPLQDPGHPPQSEKRLVGKECVSTCSTRGSPHH